MIDLRPIKNVDLEVYESLVRELNRQQNNVELIASENFVSLPVLTAGGTHLTNKYAEGYPDKDITVDACLLMKLKNSL